MPKRGGLSLALAGGSRIDDCEVISAALGSTGTVWVLSNGVDRFLPLSDVLDWSEGPPAPPTGSDFVADQLNQALNSRVLIEQAKGVIAERARLDVGHAFSWMRHYARSHNLPLVDVARSVIDGNVTPETPALNPATPPRPAARQPARPSTMSP